MRNKNNMNMKIICRFDRVYCIFAALMLFFTFAGCSGESVKEPGDRVILKGEDIVLAVVNGSPITEYELELTLDTTLGKENASKIGADGKRKVIESLVASRAIAQACEKDLTPEDMAEVAKRADAYREQILVKRYLARHATPEPVTQAMVKDYYDAHPEKFGGKTIRNYEMISTSTTPAPKERDELLSLLVKPEEKKDWEKWVNTIKNMGYPVFFKKGVWVEKLLHPKLNTIIRQLNPGETSAMSFIDGRPYLVKVTEDEATAPKPLSEVSLEIRKSLGPVQLKKAVKQISEDVLKAATVEYK